MKTTTAVLGLLTVVFGFGQTPNSEIKIGDVRYASEVFFVQVENSGFSHGKFCGVIPGDTLKVVEFYKEEILVKLGYGRSGRAFFPRVEDLECESGTIFSYHRKNGRSFQPSRQTTL